MTTADRDIKTSAVHAGRAPALQAGAVNPPVHHASTILFPDMDAYDRRRELFYDGVGYGLYATPTTLALSEAVAELEGARRCVVFPSGTAAIAGALTALTRAGSHILVADTVYGPTRAFCDEVLSRFGVHVTYYDPLIGAAIADMIRPESSLVLLESPGSMTFEFQDVPAIAAAARQRSVPTVIDATWASPFFFRALEHGVDVAVQSGTKYLSGHSDAMFGAASTNDEALFRAIKDSAGRFGARLGGDDCYLALRGLRTLPVRMARHHENGIVLAKWLAARPEVARVLHPVMPDHAGADIWRRDFKGAAGLFGIVMASESRQAAAAMVDGMKLFGLGSSWGGFESLIVPAYPAASRTLGGWRENGFLLRVHAGLEDTGDLIRDLEAGLTRWRAASQER